MPQQFEHVIVLLGFIFGLALTQLLASVSDLIHARDRVRFSWLHAVAMLLALTFFFANWLALWDMRRVSEWSVADVLSFLIVGGNQYFVCSLVSMSVPSQGKVDMVEFADRQTTPFLISVAALHIVAMLTNYQFHKAYGEAAPWLEQNLTILPMLVATLAAIAVRRSSFRIAAIALQIVIASAFAANFTFQS